MDPNADKSSNSSQDVDDAHVAQKVNSIIEELKVATLPQIMLMAQLVLPALEPGEERMKLLELLAERSFDHFEAENDFQMLEKALEYIEEALEAVEYKHDYARLGMLRAKCLQARFMRGHNERDLEQGIEWSEEALKYTRSFEIIDNGLIAQAMNIRWLCFFTKVHFFDDSSQEEVDEIVELAEEEVDLVLTQALGRESILKAKNNLGKAYEFRWDRAQHKNHADLFRALDLGREVLALVPESQQDARIGAMTNLSFRLQRAYLAYITYRAVPPNYTYPGTTLFDEALNLLTSSMLMPAEQLFVGPSNVSTFVMYIQEFPPEHRNEKLARCRHVLELSIDKIIQLCRSSAPDDLSNSISVFYGLSRWAAASVLAGGGNAFEALVLLERGRGITAMIESESGPNRPYKNIPSSEMTDLLSAEGEHRKDFDLEAEDAEDDDRKEQRRKIAEVVGSTNTLTQELAQSIARNRSIVVVNVTDVRSDAIIITEEGVEAIYLPDLKEVDVSEKSWEIQTRLAKETEQERVFPELHKHLTSLLVDLWKSVAKPVLSHLGHTTALSTATPASDWPRICWIPTGILCLYPIHAAGLGLHKTTNVMNRVISTYASSISALASNHSRFAAASPVISSQDNSACIISMAETPGYLDLTLSPSEVGVVIKAFPAAVALVGQSTDQVLAGLATEPEVVHFSCHGDVDYDRPALSLLLTSDWETSPLTVRRLRSLRLQRARLAFLSACFTANAGVENQQDEGVHLAAGLQSAGFMNVVGSAWYVGEQAALAVVERFYEELVNKAGESNIDWERDAANALHFAVLDFRESTKTAANRMRGDPVSWAPFIHFGI